jgi:DNA polymerase III delta prime subunit
MPHPTRSEHYSPSGVIDSDYAWLKSHLNVATSMVTRVRLAETVTQSLSQRIKTGRLPYTLGVFGGWGTGKTTFLALLARELEKSTRSKVVYFNAWKYAGFMEIVPALIYKLLKYGIDANAGNPDEAARRVLLALGKKYSDQVGEWAQTKIGVNPVELFKDLYLTSQSIGSGTHPIAPDVIRGYYTQVDKAQDELRQALGTVRLGKEPDNSVVALIDELDRCDPDEAFIVVKQLRVLFGMRDLPVAFVVCANPEPIGLAIKHRYGLESEAGDYEARRILEKFVDSYQDLSATEYLSGLAQALWRGQKLPWIIKIDQANAKLPFEEDVVLNATAFDVLTTSVPLFANIRVLLKSFEYVRDSVQINRNFLWTHWFLEMANQIDPQFRHHIRTLAGPIEAIASATYHSLHGVVYLVDQNGSNAGVRYDTDKGTTLFSIFRSYFWEHARKKLEELEGSPDPEDVVRSRALRTLLSSPLKVDVIVVLSLLPFERLPQFMDLCKAGNGHTLPDFSAELQGLIPEFGCLLAN